MALNLTTYALLKEYVKESLQGAGALKGEPGQPGKDATINGMNAVTLESGENVHVSLNPLTGTITISVSGSGTSETDHRVLTGRDVANQHPISAITGLEEALSTIPRAMTADELRKIINGGP